MRYEAVRLLETACLKIIYDIQLQVGFLFVISSNFIQIEFGV